MTIYLTFEVEGLFLCEMEILSPNFIEKKLPVRFKKNNFPTLQISMRILFFHVLIVLCEKFIVTRGVICCDKAHHNLLS